MAYDARGDRNLNRPYAHPNVNYYLAPGDVLADCPYDINHKILESRFVSHLSKCKVQYEKRRITNPKLPKFVPCLHNWKHHVPESEMEDHLKSCKEALKAAAQAAEESKRENEESFAGFPPSGITEKQSEPSLIGETSGVGVYDDSATKTDAGDTISFDVESSIFCESASALSAQFASYSNFTATSDPSQPNVGTRRNVREENWDEECNSRAGALQWGPKEPVYDPMRAYETQHIYYIPPGMSKAERLAYRKRMAALPRKVEVPIKDSDNNMEWLPEDPLTRTPEARTHSVAVATAAAVPKQEYVKKKEVEENIPLWTVPNAMDEFVYDYDQKS